jgi:hypothetical protein
MRNLEELTLYLDIEDRTTFVDGNHLHNDILIHMPRLHKFIFYINTMSPVDNIVHYFSDNDIQKTFINTGYEQVGSIVDYLRYDYTNDSILCAICHIFSLPFAFNRLHMLGNRYPTMIFDHVTFLIVQDYIPFKPNFFVQIARCFPLLRCLHISNYNSNHDQSYSIVEYSHLTTLDVLCAHIDYIELFLHESRTRLPQLMKLTISYNELQTVTNNFTRDATRLNCIKINRLSINQIMARPKDLYDYFPSL